jgi:hypothetical protein
MFLIVLMDGDYKLYVQVANNLPVVRRDINRLYITYVHAQYWTRCSVNVLYVTVNQKFGVPICIMHDAPTSRNPCPTTGSSAADSFWVRAWQWEFGVSQTTEASGLHSSQSWMEQKASLYMTTFAQI